MRMARLAAAALLAAAVASRAASTAGTARPLSNVDPKSGIGIEISSPFDSLPHCGFAPVRLTVRNDSDRERSWNISFSGASSYDERRSFGSGASITVAPKATKTIEVMVPLSTATETYAYPRLTTRVTGYGAPGAVDVWASGSSSFGGSRLQPFVAMADTLATTAWGPLEAKLKAESRELVGTRFVAAQAPSDYRGWMGCDAVWLAPQDWDVMAPAQRTALLDWVRLGGRLHVCGREETLETEAVPPTGPLGFGAVHPHRLRDNNSLVNAAVDAIHGEPSLINTIHNDYTSSWPLRNSIPEVVVRPGLILLFVIVFAFLVGPVNLFILARRGRHLHLFWTTPAISIAASLVLAVIIILQDGFGGRGQRFTAVYLDSDAHQTCQLQEQIARTGVLLARTLPMRTAPFLTIVNTDNSTFNRPRGYDAMGNTYGGDWYASRSVQAHLLAAVEPSRARIEITGSTGSPAVVSSLSATLADLYYRDANGRIWHGTEIRTGERQALKPADEKAFRDWWRTQAALAGGRIAQLLADIPGRRSCFFAASPEGGGHPVETLPSIRWEDRCVLYTGPVTATAAGKGAP